MPAETPPMIRAKASTSSVGAHAAEEARGDGQPDAEDEHRLSAEPVAQRAEIEDRGRQAERVSPPR